MQFLVLRFILLRQIYRFSASLPRLIMKIPSSPMTHLKITYSTMVEMNGTRFNFIVLIITSQTVGTLTAMDLFEILKEHDILVQRYSLASSL